MTHTTAFPIIFLLCITLFAKVNAQEVTLDNNTRCEGTPIAERLNTNGTLKAGDGFNSSLYINGYKVTVDPLIKSPEFFAKGKPLETQVIAWSALGSGMNDAVKAIAVSGSDVYVGGEFTLAGGSSANRIAKWNGSSWSSLGTGMDGNVFAIAVSGSDVFVGGGFTTAGGNPATSIAKWNGNSWSSLGAGINGYVYAIAVSGSNVYVGGNFTSAGGISANSIAKWNGSNWSALGTGMNIGDDVIAITVSGSDVYVGGYFATAGGISTNSIAKWNGNSWSALGTGMNNAVRAIAVLGSDVYAGGGFSTAGGSSANNIAKWNGSSWSALGSGVNSEVEAIAVSGSDVYAGGAFTTAGGSSANHIAKWNGNSWSALGGGTHGGGVEALVVNTSAGKMMVGGYFNQVDSIDAYYIASFTDSNNPLPIELTSFQAKSSERKIVLYWQTTAEVDNYGFDVERKVSSLNRKGISGVNDIWKTIGYVVGNGTSNVLHSYSFTDHSDFLPGTYYYRLKQLDWDGSYEYSKVVAVEIAYPQSIELSQNFPNPFFSSTVIRFALHEPAHATLTVYDMLGRELERLVDDVLTEGEYSATFNTVKYYPGMYSYELRTEGNVLRRQMVVVK